MRKDGIMFTNLSLNRSPRIAERPLWTSGPNYRLCRKEAQETQELRGRGLFLPRNRCSQAVRISNCGLHGLLGFLLSAASLLLLLSASSALAAPQLLPAHVSAAVARSPAVERLAATNRLNLAIGLPLRNPDALARLLRELYDPAHPNYRHYLTPEQFAARFGPSEQDYQAVIAFAQANGLAVRHTHPNRALVDVTGSVADIEQALHVTLRLYRHPTEARTFYAPDAEPTLGLAVPVLGISGLDNYALPRPRLQAKPIPNSAFSLQPSAFFPNLGSGPSGTFMGNDFRAAYVPDTALTGTGQVVGLVQFDGYNASDITYYENRAGLPNVPLTNVLLDGFTGTPSGYGGEVEVCLDIEASISMAPGLAGVIVYMAGPYGNFHDVLNRMATDNLAKQLSCSWYSPGGGADPVADQIFQQMAAQGQSFFNASGDYDAFTGPVDFPGETPYIVQVGGTTLTTSGPGGAWISETVWNWDNGIGGGGGISTRYAIPAYQADISMTLNQGSTTMRNIPDVALTADNVYVRANGRDYEVGGTSCAAPLWAGFTALVNQQAAASGRPVVGFINPTVDTIGHAASYTASFHDITTGDNTSSSSPTKFYAVAGYDLCTGWGTPVGQRLINALANPDPLLISPASLAFAGNVGGPFSPNPGWLTLTNTGTNGLSWTLVNTSAWFNVSLTSGTLLPGGLEASVSVTVDPSAAALPAGVYSTALAITNQSGGVGQSVPLALSVAVAGIADDFDPGLDLTQWSSFGGVVDSTVLATNYGGSVSGSNSLWFGASGSRYATTVPVNTSAGGQIGFCIRLANGSAWPWAMVDNLPAEGVVLECSTNGGVSWTAIGNYDTAAYYNWTGIVLPIPGVAQGPAALFRWRQLSNDGANYDHWALDSVVIGSGSLAPQITLDPQSQNVAAGDPASLSIAAVGIPACSFQWRLNGTNISGATASSLNWDRVQLTNAGTYSVFVSNSVGTATSADAVLNVYVPVCAPPAPGLVSWWAAEGDATDVLGINTGTLQGGAGYARGRVGQAFNFNPASGTVTVPDSPTLRLTNQLTIEAWINARTLNDSPGYAIVNKLSFATGNKGYQFILVGNMIQGLFNSPGLSWPSERISSGPIISTGVWYHVAFTYDQSAMKLYCNGQPVATNVIGAHAIATSSSDLRISGADDHAYFDGLIDEPSVYERALAADEIAANYNAGNAGKCRAPTPPSILTQPQSQTVALGNNVSLAVKTLGSQPLRYQWRFNATNIPAATSSTLTLTNVQFTNSGSYDVVVTNLYGSTNSLAATLTVLTPPQITGQPQDQTVGGGSNAMFTVATTGSDPLSYQWYFNGTALGAETNSSLMLNVVSLSQAGNYNVSVSNLVGSVTSRNAILVVHGGGSCAPPPAGLVSWWAGEGSALDTAGTNHGTLQGGVTFTLGMVGRAFSFNPASGTVVVPDSMNLRLTNQLTIEAWINPRTLNVSPGYAIVSKLGIATGDNGYQFILVGDTIQGLFNSPGLSWPSQRISSGGILNTGVWFHVAWTYDQSAMKLYCNGQPVATNVIGAQPIATSGSDLRISGVDTQAYFDGLVDEPSVYNRALSDAEIAGIYNAGSAGKCGLPPSILAQPQRQTAVEGSSASFAVTASGTPPLSYQWQLNSTVIEGATASSLTLTNLQDSQAGSYLVVVSNGFGSVTSSNAVLMVIPPPPCAWPSAGLVSWWPGEGSANDAAGRNTGTVQGGTSFATGIVGQAFNFDGASGCVVVPDSTSLHLTNQLTIEGWIQTRARSGDQPVVSKLGGVGGNNGYQFLVSGNTLVGLFNSPGQGWPSASVASAGLIVTGVWQHVAYTYDQSAMKLYLNGLPVATNVVGAKTIATSSSTLRLGAVEGNPCCYFNGLIDEASVYNRALSASEIAGIYQAGSAGKCALAPAVQTPPQSQTIELSSNVTYSVTAAGMVPLAYQWYFGANPKSGGTNATLTLTNVAFAQAGSYSVVITNTYGSATGGPAVLTVVDTTPPTIISCPTNRTRSAGANCITVLPDLTGELVAWDASGPVTVAQSPPAGTLLGLGITNVSFTVLDSSRNASTCTCMLTIADNTAPFVQACVLEVALGFDTNCMALLPDLTTTKYIIANDNCSAVSIVQAPPAQTALPVGTNIVLLTVSDAASNQTTRAVNVVVAGPPQISAQPTNLSAVLSSNVVVSVTACGSSSLYYQWQHAGTNLLTGTNAVLTLSNLQTNDAGDYQVVVTNSVGSITSVVATLTVLQPPVITGQPWNVVAAPGASVSFSVEAEGPAPLTYQWQKNGAPLTDQTDAWLIITNVQSGDFASYTVGITNRDGGVLSEVAALTLAASPSISSLHFNLTTFMFTVPTEVGPTYVVEYKDSLKDPSWHQLTTLAGTGSSIPISDNGLTNSTRFYRVRVR